MKGHEFTFGCKSVAFLRSLRFYEVTKIVQYGLPAVALHVFRILAFRVKALANMRQAVLLAERNFNFAAVAHGVSNQLVWDHIGVYAAKIKAHTAINGFHPA